MQSMASITLQQLLQQIKRLLTEKVNRHFYVFAVCLAIATALWLLNAFTKNYNTLVQIPIKYKNLPADKVLLSELPTEIQLEVEGYGFDLLTFNNQITDTITVNCAGMQFKNNSNKLLGVVTIKPFYELITNSLPNNIAVKNFITDSIFIDAELRISKRVPIKPNVTWSAEKQFRLEDSIRTEPSFVVLEGPKSTIDSIQYIETKPLELLDLHSATTVEVDLDIPSNSHITSNVTHIKEVIPIEQFTEASIVLDLNKIYPDFQDSLQFIQRFIEVKFLVSLKQFNRIEPSNFSVQLSPIPNSLGNRFSVTVSPLVKRVEILSYAPQKVEYLLLQPAAQTALP